MTASKNFIPQTREEAVSEYTRVAVENLRIGRRLGRRDNVFTAAGRKMMNKAKRIKAAADWKAVMFSVE